MSKLKYDEGAIVKMLNQGRRVEEVSVALDVPEIYIKRYFSHLRVDGWQKPLDQKKKLIMKLKKRC